MNNLTKALLGGAALSVLAVVPAVAQQKHPAFSITAMHSGRAVNKTKNSWRCIPASSSCTASIYTNVSAADFRKTVPLVDSFYKFNSYSTICSNPKQKIKVDRRKTDYGKASVGTQTYSQGCPSGPTTYYGDFYKLTDKSGEGHEDIFNSEITGKFKNKNGTYKGRLILGVYVFIGTE